MSYLQQQTQSPVATAQPQASGKSLLDVGNLLILRQEIDPSHRITNHIRSKLHIVDLIPAYYTIDFSKIGTEDGNIVSLDYDKAMGDYTELCGRYGLPGYPGVRLWLTDDTTAAENITQEYADNFISQSLNKLSSISNIYKSLSVAKSAGGSAYSSFSQQAKSAVAGGISQIGASTASGLGEGGVEDTELVQQISSQLGNLAGSAVEMILTGKKMSLPKVWSSSSYQSSLSLNAKLVSPYGDPKAVQNYIVKPLVYLLLLAASKSSDGLTYGLSTPLRIKAYGLSDINLGAISSISIQRGNMNISYNQYRQPLIIDVRISIMPLIDGFAAMTEKMQDIDTVDSSLSERENEITNEDLPGINTVGNVIRSLRPVPKSIAKYAELPKSAGLIGMLGGLGAEAALGTGVLSGLTTIPDTLSAAVSSSSNFVSGAVSNVSNAVGSAVSSGVNKLNTFFD
jgi:hypothetical protein